MDPRYLGHVQDMIESIDKILRFIDTTQGLDDFLNNELVIDAVTRNFEIIGEASNKIPDAIKDKYPNIPWKQMQGLRNFAIHEYQTIDPIVLWEIAQDHLIDNKAELEYLLDCES